MSMTIDQAVLHLRRDPHFAQYIRDAYWDADARACAERFRQSGEFGQVLEIIGGRRTGAVLDLGAGNGIASYAFSLAGARIVYALEPDPSRLVGRGAIRDLTEGMPVEILGAYGEAMPLPDRAVDIVYARQVLHHTRDLGQVLRECSRVLKSGGMFLACREHVVDNQAQLEAFLRQHLMHQLTGNENAFTLSAYLEAIQAALQLTKVLGPWDSVINAFPGVKTQAELAQYPQRLLGERWGNAGAWAGRFPMVQWMVWTRLKRPVPGRMYTFVAVKP